MTRALEVVDAADPADVMVRLAAALAGTGPALLPRERGVDTAAPAVVASGVAVVIETSGSTARPKQVALSADALLASAAATAEAIGQGQWLLALPVHYVAGLQVLVRSLAAGSTPVILPGGHFDAAAFRAAAGHLSGTGRYTALVPTQLARLLDAARTDARLLTALRSFDAILLGGQRAPAGLIDGSAPAGLRVIRTYGSSETAGGCVYDGAPLGRTHARVHDGQLELAGPMLAEGYVGDEARTAESFVVDGGLRWYRTGDVGTVTETEHGTVVEVFGRLDDVFISGGIKVSAGDVERVVQTLEGLQEAVVLAVADHEWGQRAVVIADGRLSAALPSLAAVRSRVVAELGPAAAPRELMVLADGLPRLSSGKPNRRALLALLEHG
ncbi:MAG: AMP-binding protein [Microbacteriaceae bacterium]